MNAVIHQELIGSVPSVEEYRNDIRGRIEVWERSREKMLKSGKQFDAMQHGVNAMIIELIAMHFYGLKSTEFGSMQALVKALKEIDT